MSTFWVKASEKGYTVLVQNVVSPKRRQSETSSVRSANFLYPGVCQSKNYLSFISQKKKEHVGSPRFHQSKFLSLGSSAWNVISLKIECTDVSVRNIISQNLISILSVRISKTHCESDPLEMM